MSAAQHWIAVSAISALGIGMLASGAIGVASAMPLTDTTTASDVPPISTVPGEGKGGHDSADVTFPVPSSSPGPSSTISPTADPSVEQAPVPAPQPVAPRPAATTDDSLDSADSAAIDDD